MAPKQEIFITVGLPGTGKSTWAAQFIEGALESESNPRVINYLSSDQLRGVIGKDEEDQSVSAQVFAFIAKEVSRLLSDDENHNDIFVDATHMSKRSRFVYVELAKQHGVDISAFVFTNHDLLELDSRMRLRQRNGGRYVPVHVLERMIDQYEEPTFDEGFTFICTKND